MRREPCNYRISSGFIDMIMGLTGLKKQDIWSHLADETQVCLDRIAKKKLSSSWRWTTFPDTDIRIKVTVHPAHSYKDWRTGEVKHFPHRCEIKFDPDQTEEFTSEQVEEYLDGMLLGVDDEEIT
jgi:hypothetical protein